MSCYIISTPNYLTSWTNSKVTEVATRGFVFWSYTQGADWVMDGKSPPHKKQHFTLPYKLLVNNFTVSHSVKKWRQTRKHPRQEIVFLTPITHLFHHFQKCNLICESLKKYIVYNWLISWYNCCLMLFWYNLTQITLKLTPTDTSYD